MRRFVPQMSVARRQRMLDEARDAGRRGAERVPDTVLFGNGDPSDSMVIKMTDALLEGRAEREQEPKL